MFAHCKIYVNGPTDITKRWQEHVEPVGSNTSSQVNQKEAGAAGITKRLFVRQRVRQRPCCPGYQSGRNDLGIVFIGPGSPRTPSGLSPRVLHGPVEAEGAATVATACHLSHGGSARTKVFRGRQGRRSACARPHTRELCCTRAHLSKQYRSGGVPLWFWLPEKGNQHEWPG